MKVAYFHNKSEIHPSVMPAKAGIQKYRVVKKHWTPAFAGVKIYEFAPVASLKNVTEGDEFEGNVDS